MKHNLSLPSILMADDDPDDRMLVKEALEENNLRNPIHFVEDGTELLDYLHRRGRFITEKAPKPALILLDLNMPKMDGREALHYIKSDPSLRRIPVVVLTTSKAEEDIVKTYDLGVNSFICKPVRFDELVEVTREIGNYWFGTVALPRA
ncbi:Response regulator receiver domain-containing protein [Chryseolinea serpens]|uniref:Response regulator receiver domain-containing protein n=1 Tax=Chryseolinea serpens TaxID=947013 RepID=A0A1M5WYF7_9BACT|nr:response regulator [Chryseolinea serpens]SHH92587.1 Response regulator receiver domain-containing protein [Chryseolinea serpens]